MRMLNWSYYSRSIHLPSEEQLKKMKDQEEETKLIDTTASPAAFPLVPPVPDKKVNIITMLLNRLN